MRTFFHLIRGITVMAVISLVGSASASVAGILPAIGIDVISCTRRHASGAAKHSQKPKSAVHSISHRTSSPIHRCQEVTLRHHRTEPLFGSTAAFKRGGTK